MALVMPPPFAPPPGYCDASLLPSYSPSAQESEQLLALPEWQDTGDRSVLSEYITSSKGILLNLGPKQWPTQAPCYPRGGVVEGYVDLQCLKTVTKIDVKLCGILINSLTERGLAMGQIERELVSTTENLYTETSTTDSSGSHRFGFSIPIPQFVQGSTEPLPPSFAAYHPRVTSQVKYVIKVDVTRRGLRRHSTLKSIIYHLPTSFSNLPRFPIPVNQAPIQLPVEDKGSSRITAELHLPQPKVYPSSAPIPWTLTLTSLNAPFASRLLSQNVNVELIKSVALNVGGNRSTRESVLGQGEVWAMDQREEGTFVMHGTVQGGKQGAEYSWHIPNAISVRFMIRVTIRPSRDNGVSVPLPTIRHEESVTITTHDTRQDEQLSSFPAIGLLSAVKGGTELGIGVSSFMKSIG